jgi:hypothetical protein
MAQETMIYATALIGLFGVCLLSAVIGVKLTLMMPGQPMMLAIVFSLAAVLLILLTTVFGFPVPIHLESPTLTLLRGDTAALLPYIIGLWLIHQPVKGTAKNF